MIKIKGKTSYKETSSGIIPRSKLLKLEIEGTKKGLDFIYQLARNQDIKITSELICKLHEVSFAWIFPKWAGKYRKIQVTISGHEAPFYIQVPEMMFNLCGDLDTRFKHLPKSESDNFIVEVVKLLAWFQHQFVLIHPFQDYNGRTARMLTIFLLLKLNLPPIEIKVENKSDRNHYINALQKADKGDLSFLEDLLSQTLQESLGKV